MVMRYFISSLFALVGMSQVVMAQAAELHATVDRKEVILQEHLVLTLSLINSDTRLRAQGVSPNVDLSVLTKDFDVGTPHVANRYNIYRGQGRSTSELSVDLFPRRSGRMTIPAFSVDGLNTAPIVIEVHPLPSDGLPEIFSKPGISSQRVWQRQQVVAWLDVYHRIRLKTASIGEYIDTEPMAIELLEHQDLPQSERKETVRGITYDVTRIAWAIFPKQSGTLTIHLPDVWAVTTDGRKLRLPHQQQRIEVKALPTDVTADIPVGTPLLTRTKPDPAPTLNNVSTWTVTVRGPFSRFALPDTLPLPMIPDHIKLYNDHARRNTETVTGGLTSVVDYTLSALPQNGGTFKLPPVRIPYFDTKQGIMAVAVLAGPVFTVPTAATAPTNSEQTTIDNGRIHTVTENGNEISLWQLTTVFFAAMWIITALWPWKRSRVKSPDAVHHEPAAREAQSPTIHHPLQAELLTAFGSRTLEHGLSAWERRHGSDAQLRDTVRAVQKLCYGEGKDSETDSLVLAVKNAVVKIRSNDTHDTSRDNDPWRPESFSVNPSHR